MIRISDFARNKSVIILDAVVFVVLVTAAMFLGEGLVWALLYGAGCVVGGFLLAIIFIPVANYIIRRFRK